MRNVSTAGLLLLCGAALALSGCQSLRESAGLTKKSPDEFAVTTKAPLVIPPDFALRPPTPGAAPTNQVDPTDAAQTALFNSSDPATVAAGMKGNFSTGEKMLLATAGAANADPGVRQQLQSDRRSMQGADPSFTAKLLGTAPTPDNGQPINADAELEKRKGASGAAAQPKKDSGGWFDWF